MAFKLKYGLYNVGQYPEKLDEAQALADAGWRPLATQLNYNEIYILWALDTPDEQAKDEQPSGEPAEDEQPPGPEQAPAE